VLYVDTSVLLVYTVSAILPCRRPEDYLAQ